MNSICSLWEVAELPALLANTVEEIREALERCLSVELSGVVPDSFSRERLSVYAHPVRPQGQDVFGLTRQQKDEIISRLKEVQKLLETKRDNGRIPPHGYPRPRATYRRFERND